jgi:hypothetical protein
MKQDWVKVFSTKQLYEAKVTEALLRENDIDVYVMNKQDSSYGVLLPGEVELYTPAKSVLQAKALIQRGLEE